VALSTLVWNMGIGTALRMGAGWAHFWPYWAQLIRR
jgi:hypothetical protein